MKQIKNKIDEFGEVFTSTKEVNGMLDIVVHRKELKTTIKDILDHIRKKLICRCLIAITRPPFI